MPRSSTLANPSSTLLRFRMPAEWEPHAATWLAWPHYKLDWPGKFEPIPWVYAEIVRYLSRRERVELIVRNAAEETSARKTLKRAHALNQNVRFHRWPTNRVWTRDSGCTFVFPRGAGAPAREPSETKARLSFRPAGAGAQVRLRPGPSTARATTPVYSHTGRAQQSSEALAAIKWRFNA